MQHFAIKMTLIYTTTKGGRRMVCDTKSFSKLYESVYMDLYRFALCLMHQKQDAEDAVSEAVVVAYENIDKLQRPEAFKSWIFTILSNICKKRWKDPTRANLPLETFQGAKETDLSLPIDVKKAFFILQEEEQLIVAYSVFGGYNSTEIGEMMNLNSNTVRSKRSRALEKMGCILKA